MRELTVIKRNGRRVPFDRDKLMRSVQIALRKRPVDPERIEKMVSKIVRELESQGENEVSSETIGELVMEHLRELDDVAYVRFASVYRNFREAKDFRAALDELQVEDGRPSPAGEMTEEAADARGRGCGRGHTDHDDARFMALALALGRRGLGQHLAQPGGRRGDRQGRRHPRRAAGRSPAAGRMPRSRRCATPRKRRAARPST